MDKVFFRGQTTAGHQHISGADRRRIAERNLYVIIIILFQKRICNDTENVIVVVVPVFGDKTGGDLFKLIGKAAFGRHIKAAFQSRCYGILMLLPVFPKKRAAGVFSAAGVRNIEYIFEFWGISVRVDQSDTTGAAPDISVQQFAVPHIIGSAGSGIGTLGEDHKLLMVGVFVQPCGSFQKCRPLSERTGDLSCRVVCHLCV
ncbi:MAG: hypothetical protein IKI93_15620 [Clostridia bacterium]|nr:hypothetical protein [Clostridia bacterium]